jgi:hypothetical protein
MDEAAGGGGRGLRAGVWTTFRSPMAAPDARVDVCLAKALAGEDVLATRVETVKGRFDFGPSTAHTGHEIREALDVQARQVADLLGIH